MVKKKQEIGMGNLYLPENMLGESKCGVRQVITII